MKILVTGGAGFIGSNIVDALIDRGHSVIVLDNLITGKLEYVNPKAKFIKQDICCKDAIADIFSKENIDIVIHHAAQIDVRKSLENPPFDASVNIIGTLNLLEEASKNRVKKIIFASSGGTIYGECVDGIPPDENYPCRPISPYGIAKYTAEMYMRFYSNFKGLPFTSLRYANVYGPRQDPLGEAGVVAIFSNRMLKSEEVSIFGDGKQTRDYVYVEDVVRANILALDRGDNEVINIGTGVETSVYDLFTKIAKFSNYNKKPIFKSARAGEIFRSVLEIKKSKKVLGWEPLISLDEGIKRTIEFFANKK